ncbi:MAG TPA: outer membrane lipoprotein carrier protein LolA [Deltaproteobacteria bacterium]|nr:outer membrane lipoprotein carrier protein LolA [Deltaproteobacteria bacterium]
MLKKWKSSLIILAALLGLAVSASAGSLEDIQKEYMNFSDFIVNFSQDTHQTIVDKKIHFTGSVAYKRDIGVRMDVYTPQRQIIILKGQTVIIHLPDEKTTTQQEIPKEIATQNILGFFSGLASIETDYIVEDTGEYLVLYPKGGTGFISIWADDAHHLSRILLKDATGNSSDISLSDYRFNVGILDDVFTLNVDQPEGSAPASQ